MEDRFRYDGKRVLVVGCYSGMGAAAAKVVSSLGGEVHGVDFRDPDYELASFTRCDLRDRAAIDDLLASLSGPIDRLFYCAGLPQTRPAPEVFAVNFAAMRHVVEGVHPHIPKGGAVAIISSNAGLQFIEHMPLLMEVLGTDGYDGALRLGGHAPRRARRRLLAVEGGDHRLHDEARHRCRRGRRPRRTASARDRPRRR